MQGYGRSWERLPTLLHGPKAEWRAFPPGVVEPS
jgi:hypothetical protein